MRPNKLAILSFGMCFPDHEFLKLDERTLLVSAEDLSLVDSVEPSAKFFHASTLRNHVHGLVTSARVQHHPFTPLHPPNLRAIILTLLESGSFNQISTYENFSRPLLLWLREVCRNRNIRLCIIQSPGYLNSSEDLHAILDQKLFSLQSFYWHQRKRLRILLDETGEPIESEIDKDPVAHPSFDPADFCITHSRFTLDLADSLQEFDPYYNEVFLNLEMATSRKEALRHSEHILRTFPKSDTNNKIVIAAMQANFSPINQYLEAGIVLPMEIVRKAVVFRLRYRLSFKSVEQLVRHIIGKREFSRFAPSPAQTQSSERSPEH